MTGVNSERMRDEERLAVVDGGRRCGASGPGIVVVAGRALACVSDGQIQGYGVIRQCRSGCKVGPLFADDPAIADRLFSALATYAENQPVFLDVPEPNSAAVALAEQYKMQPVFQTARMYTGPTPVLALDKVFGVTSFELG